MDAELTVTETRLRTPFDADCWECASEISDRLAEAGHWMEAMSFPMFLCPTCGNKRCPRASNHGNECTRSNASGQPGSVY